MEENRLKIPGPELVKDFMNPLPFVIIGDEAFPLKPNLLRPYPTNIARDNERKKIYNYRHCRARRVVENSFGIMTQKFRLFFGRMHVSPENADKIIKAACVLHNYLRDERIFPDNEPDQNSTECIRCFTSLRHMGGNYSEEAIDIRERFCSYFNSTGAVPWQLEVVRRGRTLPDDDTVF